jgi:hypothetical protein
VKGRGFPHDSAIGRPDNRSSVNQRRRLVDAIDRLDVAMQMGDVTPTRAELQALARICYEQGLIDELLRVRRWLLKV